jgi:hypothetical protein
MRQFARQSPECNKISTIHNEFHWKLDEKVFSTLEGIQTSMNLLARFICDQKAEWDVVQAPTENTDNADELK